MLVYNNPRYSGYNIHPAFMARLVEAVPNIFGAKLAMGSVDEAMAYMKMVKAPFAPYALASNLVSAMSVGVAGTISPPLAVTPEIGVDLVRAIDAGEAERSAGVAKRRDPHPRYFSASRRSLRPDDLLRGDAAARLRREDVSALAVQAAQPGGV